LTRALEEIVWAVNPRHDTLDSLVDYLFHFAEEFLEHARIRCRVDAPFQLPPSPVSAEVRHNLFLAFKEALNNVVKHAKASEVRVQFELLAEGFCLAILDNGCGFDPSTDAPSASGQPSTRTRGNGLRNLGRRLSSIGGTCEIRSRPGQGTTVRFLVPLSRSSREGANCKAPSDRRNGSPAHP